MAEKTVSQTAFKVNENSAIHMEYMAGDTPAVLSTDVALRFQRKHSHILRDIDRIRSQVPKIFFETNFGFNEQEVEGGFGVRKERRYLLTRDAFSLLVMGFTGKAAIQWKLRYIEAFNTLETAVLENRAALARDLGYQQGLSDARALPAAEQKRPDALAVVERAVGYLCKGLTMTDAAALTGCPASTLRGRLNRVRKLVAELPEKHTGGVTA